MDVSAGSDGLTDADSFGINSYGINSSGTESFGPIWHYINLNLLIM